MLQMCWHGGSVVTAYNLCTLVFSVPSNLMTSRQTRLQEDTYFRLMSILLENPKLTQRELASKLGLSLGGLNYCLRALIEKGFVKMQNFNKAENKLKFVYLLTPRGIKEKSALTYRFLERKMQEHEALNAEIQTLKREVDLSAAAKGEIKC